jgi:hypothetical protein
MLLNEEYNKTIDKQKNFLPKDLFSKVAIYLQQEPGWKWGWISETGNSDTMHKFFNKTFAGPTSIHKKFYDCESELDRFPLMKEVFSHIKAKYPDDILVRMYANMTLHSVDGSIHKDDSIPGMHTVVIYGHPMWNNNWGGAIAFTDENGDIVSCHFPTPNTMVSFDGFWDHFPMPVAVDTQIPRICIVTKSLSKERWELEQNRKSEVFVGDI